MEVIIRLKFDFSPFNFRNVSRIKGRGSLDSRWYPQPQHATVLKGKRLLIMSDEQSTRSNKENSIICMLQHYELQVFAYAIELY